MKAYSEDLRRKIVEALDRGTNKTQAGFVAAKWAIEAHLRQERPQAGPLVLPVHQGRREKTPWMNATSS
jgi:hypothetical protein